MHVQWAGLNTRHFLCALARLCSVTRLTCISGLLVAREEMVELEGSAIEFWVMLCPLAATAPGHALRRFAKAVTASDPHPSTRTEKSDMSAATSSGKKGSYNSQADGQSGNYAMKTWIQQSPRDDPWSVAARFGRRHADMTQGQEADIPKKNQETDKISLGDGTLLMSCSLGNL